MTVSDERLKEMIEERQRAFDYESDHGMYRGNQKTVVRKFGDIVVALKELLALRKHCAELEAERDAWREDAERLFDTHSGIVRIGNEALHSELVAKYPVEKPDDAEWTAEEILKREG